MSVAPPPPSAASAAPPPAPPAASATTPLADASPTSRPPLATARSHQSGRIEQHWNDLPSNFLTPANSSPSSRAVSPLRSQRSRSRLRSADQSPVSSSAAATPDEFEPLIERLFDSSRTPSKLKPAQLDQLKTGVLKAEIEDAQKGEVAGVLKRVLERECSPQEGKKELVAFLMREQGVVAWLPKVRQGVENVIIE